MEKMMHDAYVIGGPLEHPEVKEMMAVFDPFPILKGSKKRKRCDCSPREKWV